MMSQLWKRSSFKTVSDVFYLWPSHKLTPQPDGDIINERPFSLFFTTN